MRVRLIIGKGGATVKTLRSRFGEAEIIIPSAERKDGTTTPVTIKAGVHIVRKILRAINHLFVKQNEEATFLKEALKNLDQKKVPRPKQLMSLDIPKPTRRTLLGRAPSRDAPIDWTVTDPSQVVSRRSTDPGPEVTSSGWGPLVDENIAVSRTAFIDNTGHHGQSSHSHDSGLLAVTHLSDRELLAITHEKDQQLQLSQLQQQSQPQQPLSQKDHVLEDKQGFLPHSQHLVLDDIIPRDRHRQGD